MPRSFAVLAVVCALGLGVVVGALTDPIRARVLDTRTVVRTDTVARTPKACLEALDIAEATFAIAADVIGSLNQGQFEEASDRLEDFEAQIEPWSVASTTCRKI